MATDPDADRLGSAEQSDSPATSSHNFSSVARIPARALASTSISSLVMSLQYKLIHLLGWWMLFNWKETHSDPAFTEMMYLLATTVSSKILKAFAWIESFHFEGSCVAAWSKIRIE
uniref:Uncharacterized protein n=1 Tax=Oncorhynchus tshawytscha TaxID=74940 RepID=A0AAZ3P0Y3_ONCTS